MRAYQHPEALRQRFMKEVVSYEALNLYDFEETPKIVPPVSFKNKTMKDFEEVEKGFSKHQALRSAERCFNCGICSFCFNCYEFCPDLAIHLDGQSMEREIDYDHCKGCGICVEECPRAALRMVQE